MSAWRVLRSCVGSWAGVALLMVAGSACYGATTRIAGVVDSQDVATLAGGLSPKLARATDMGIAPAGQRIELMSLRFTMTDAQQASLTQLLEDLQNPASPKYHQWLTPEQFGAQFGLAAEDLAKVSAWLTAQGFTVTSVARGGMFVQFSGTVAQANAAFRTELHTVSLGGEVHVANVSAPSLPKSIAAVTAAVTGLSDFRLKPHHLVRPQYSAGASGPHYIAPGDFYTIYDEGALITGGINGSGVTLAVVGQTDVLPADIATFRTASGLAANAPTVVLYGTDPGLHTGSLDFLESTLDLEWSGAVAPKATVLFANSLDVIDGSLTQAVDNNIAPIIADSYGDCEPNLGAGDLVYYNAILQMAAAEGITITAAAGDDGATDCEAGGTSAKSGLAIDFPADSPYVTGVGGTEFSEGAGNYWSATNGANGGSALSYIPEVVWNDYASAGGISAGGGGASAYFSKPSWQVGTGVPLDFARDVPDVSLNASAFHDGYLVCTNGFCVSGYKSVGGTYDVVGGTSVGSPAFAGLMALVEQKTGARIGVANNTLYALANSSYAASVFHDVTVGNNSSPCTVGTTNCPTGGSIGYSATAGYDLASGWGSVDAFNLVNNWAKVTPLATTGGQTPTYTSLAGSATSVSQGTAVTLTATVVSAITTVTTTPSGTVRIAVDGTAVGSGVTLASGATTYNLSTASLSVGAHTVQATYTGDANFMGSKAVFLVNVTSAAVPDFTLSPATATVTTKSGTVSPGTLFTVSSLNGFSGNVTFLASYSATLNVHPTFTVNPATVTGTTAGSTTLSFLAYSISSLGTPVLAKPSGVEVATRRGFVAGSGIALAGLLLVMLPRRRRFHCVLMALIGVVAMSLSGCLSSTNTSQVPVVTGTPPGTYTITVSASGTVGTTPVTHSSTLTLIVQ